MLSRNVLRAVFLACDAWILLACGWGALRQAWRALSGTQELTAAAVWIEALRLVLLPGLALGVWSLAARHRSVVWIVWLQLPARVFFAALGEPMYLSLAFARPALLWLADGRMSPVAVLGVLGAFDLLRAGLTLLLRPRARA